MKPAPFDYLRAQTVDEAVAALAEAGGDGKIIAGGQSLAPVLALRLSRPSLLVDVNRIPGLAGVSPAGDRTVRVGAMTRHAALAAQSEHPLLAEAARWIGHAAIRSRGTAGGSIAHADPSAELPVVAVALDAVVEVAGPGTSRVINSADLFEGPFQTTLDENEMITALQFPIPTRWGFAEFSRRHGDFGLVTVVAAEVGDRIRIAIGGMGAVPIRAVDAEAFLAERRPTARAVAEAAVLAAHAVQPSDDIHATAAFRQAMTKEFTRRALQQLAHESVGSAA